MEGLSVLEGKFNEVLERLDVLEGWFNDRLKGWDVLEGLACTWRRAQWEDGKVGMYLQRGLKEMTALERKVGTSQVCTY